MLQIQAGDIISLKLGCVSGDLVPGERVDCADVVSAPDPDNEGELLRKVLLKDGSLHPLQLFMLQERPSETAKIMEQRAAQEKAAKDRQADELRAKSGL